MSSEAIRTAIEMTAHPKLSQLLALLIEHGSLTASDAAPLLDLPPFMVLRFANRLVCLGYATRRPGNDERYLATIAGCEIDAVMRGPRP
jgi:hypothetical protein